MEKNIRLQARREGMPIPARIKNKPRLRAGLSVFLDAFYALEHDRSWLVGMTAIPQPISWSVIDRFADRANFDSDLREELLFFIRALDNAYIKRMTAK